MQKQHVWPARAPHTLLGTIGTGPNPAPDEADVMDVFAVQKTSRQSIILSIR